MSLAVNVFYIKKLQVFEITYLCKLADIKSAIVLSFEHSDYKWASLGDLKQFKLDRYMSKVIETSKTTLFFQG